MSVASLQEVVGWIRTALETVTTGNGYPVTIRSAGGTQDENPWDTPPSLLPKAWVYLPGEGTGGSVTDLGNPNFGKGSASATIYVDIWFAPKGTYGEEVVFDYLGSVLKALRTASHGALSFRLSAAGEWQFQASPRRCMVRCPVTATVTMTMDET